jgi:Na+-driven multidrug efflux pump
LCYFLGVYLEKGPIGVWMGLTVGLVLASIALYWRFRHKTLRMH